MILSWFIRSWVGLSMIARLLEKLKTCNENLVLKMFLGLQSQTSPVHPCRAKPTAGRGLVRRS